MLEQHASTLDYAVIGQCSVLGTAGALTAAVLGNRLPQALLRRVFGAFLIVLALMLIAVRPPAA